MSEPVVKINAIEVAPEMGPKLEQRFAERAAEVEKMPGFLGFELLRPVEGETRYFVYTRWASEEHFQAWVKSDAFTRGHAQAARDRGTVAHGAELMSFDVVMHVEGEAGDGGAAGAGAGVDAEDADDPADAVTDEEE